MQFLSGAAEGQTPLDPDEAEQLIPSAVTSRADLDIVEAENIALALRWALGTNRAPEAVLDESFLRRLHKRMFDEVWRWAGAYRQTARNIGVDWWLIPQEIGQLIGDAKYWIEHDVHERDVHCIRFHHQLVKIHPFPNGNGRHARLAADVLSVSLGGEPLRWGAGTNLEPAALRARYIASLQAADDGDLTDLIAFARSEIGTG